MLPARHRMTRGDDFTRAVRRGRRAARPTVVAHYVAGPSVADATDPSSVPTPALVGLVVSKAVGGSVRRHAVSRRLRHQMRPRLTRLDAGSLLVLRAQPPAAAASSHELGADLDRVLERLLGPVTDRAGAPA